MSAMITPAVPVRPQLLPDRESVRQPSYPVAAIDNTLRTLALLNSIGEVRVVEVARHLGVARSTAHRILSMLTYHGFAEQDEAKHYRLRMQAAAAATGVGANHDLVLAARPALVELARSTGHTAHVIVLEGNGARFLHGVVSQAPGALGSREGVLYPAHLTAGGRAILAELSELELRRLFPSRIGGRGVPAIDHRVIGRALDAVRRRGYAANEGENEAGVNAVGLALHDDSHSVSAALVVAATADRLPRASFAPMAGRLATAAKDVVKAMHKGRTRPRAGAENTTGDESHLVIASSTTL